MKTVLRLLAFLKPFTGEALASVMLGTAAVSCGIGLLGVSAYLIASAALHPSVAELQVAIVGVRFFGLSRAVFRYLERLVSHSVNFRLLARLRVWFFTALEPLAPARLWRYHSGDLLTRAVADVDTHENFYVRVVAPPIVALICTAGVSLFVGQYEPLLGLTLATGLVVAGAFVPWLNWRMTASISKAAVFERARLNEELVEGLQGLPDLFIYGQQQVVIDRLACSSRLLAQAEMRLTWRGGFGTAVSLLVALLTLWIVLWLAIPLVNTGIVDGVSLAVIVLIAIASFEAVSPLPQAAQQLEMSLQAARRLFALVDAEPAIQEPAHPAPAPARFDIEIDDLSFRYRPDLPPALDHIRLSIPQGKKLAIVGPSGAGKSTLIQVLVRFVEYQGSVCFGGRELRDYASGDIRSKIAVVAQSDALFAGTVQQNLLMASPAAGEQQIETALDLAGLSRWVAGLPEGLNTWVGEQGVQMSAGERQRLVIARALLKQAPVVVMDEPASNLDSSSEMDILTSLRGALAGCSVLLVTHRLVAMDWMDEIVVLNAGRIIERGTHAELLIAGGLYARMWKSQNRMLSAAREYKQLEVS